MSYNLFIKVLGSSKKELVAKIDLDFNISDFVCVDGLGYVFLLPENDCLALYDTSSKKLIMPWIGKINNRGCKDGYYKCALLDRPSSICVGKGYNNYYMIEQNGKMIRHLNMFSGYVTSHIGGVTAIELGKYFCKVKTESVHKISSCVVGCENIYWSNDVLNRIFSYSSSIVNNVMGGRCGYSVSSHVQYSNINAPTGLVCHGSEVLFSDSKNNCIRSITNNGVNLLAGIPNNAGIIDGHFGINKLMCPGFIRISNNMVYFIDVDKVRYFSLADKVVGTVYSSKDIVSIAVNKKNLVLLERS